MPEGLTPQSRIDLGPDATMLADDDSPLMVEVVTEVRKRLMSEPYFEAKSVRELMGDVDIDSLVADGTLLAYEDHGDYLFPVFQFDKETHRPFEVVSSINRILDAPNDGWGTLGWWVQTNGWLSDNTAPVQLLNNPLLHPTLLQLAEGIVNDDSY